MALRPSLSSNLRPVTTRCQCRASVVGNRFSEFITGAAHGSFLSPRDLGGRVLTKIGGEEPDLQYGTQAERGREGEGSEGVRQEKQRQLGLTEWVK